jgi:hypothetical protein
MIGDSNDIVSRVKQEIPKRWFRWVAPYRDAILGGLADLAAWNYNLIGYARAQSRLATAYGIWLDILAFDFLGFFLTRKGLSDDSFRIVIRSTILQERVTRNGMSNLIKALTGNAPAIFEPWNTFDTGAYSSPGGASAANQYGSMGYNVGRGGYGNMSLPGQTFVNIIRGSGSGIPNVGGYNNPVSGYGAGSIEYLGKTSELSGITDAIIYNMINTTKPTGTTCWVAFVSPISPLTTESGLILLDDSGNILVSR